MRIIPGLILLAALAGCGGAGPQGNNAASQANASVNASAPASAPAPAPAAADDTRRLAEFREDSLRGCIGGGRETAPPGTPVDRHCACAVDRVMAGRGLAALEAEERGGGYDTRFQGALRACIAEIGN